MEKFYDYMSEECEQINKILEQNNPMIDLTPEEKRSFEQADKCLYCRSKFNHDKTAHHCHVSGRFLGPACNRCNLQLKFRRSKNKFENKTRYFVPVVCHNTKHYDSHLILKYFRNRNKDMDIHVISSNTEVFISFQIGYLRFLDSNQFMTGSLDGLVKTLGQDGNEKFVHTRRHFPDNEQFLLAIRKGVYPYEHVNSTDKFDEVSLPPKHVSIASLLKATSVIQTTSMQKMCGVNSTFKI